MSHISHRDVQQQIIHSSDMKHLENFGEPANVRIKRTEFCPGMSSEPNCDDCLKGNAKRTRIHLCVEPFENLGVRQLANSRETTRRGQIDLCREFFIRQPCILL